jgi:quinol monooxygenase YgiN
MATPNNTDWASIASALAAIVALGISVWVALWQGKLQKERVQQDLFDKRYAVFLLVDEFMMYALRVDGSVKLNSEDAVMLPPGKNPGPHRAFIFTIYLHPRMLSQRHIGRRDLPAPCQGASSRNAVRRPNYKGENAMVKLAFYARLEAKPGKEKEVEQFLQSAVPLVEEEQGTITWYALRMGPSTFGIFDTFNDEAGRQAHLSGKVAAALMAKAPDLFAKAPEISKVDVLASKVADAKRKASA